MKALSLHPMYAAEIAVGNKPEEYRTWETKYRGDLLICASQYNDGWEYPRGYALCVVRLAGIKPPDDEGIYAWQLENVRPIVPFPVKGKLYLYDVDDKLIKFAKRKANVKLFDWWQDDLKIIVPPEEKKVNKPKQEITKKAKVEEPKHEVAKKIRPRLRSI